jgi:formamidopyrimidine-DNA glycosylase
MRWRRFRVCSSLDRGKIHWYGGTPRHPRSVDCYPEALPELPEVEAIRRSLEPWLTGARFDEVEVRRVGLRKPFPGEFRTRLVGQTVVTLSRRAKYLLAALSSADVLMMHLGMSGSFSVEVRGQRDDRESSRSTTHDHVVFHMSSGAIITFTDPRRFGVMDLLTPETLASHLVLLALGPEPLSAGFDAAALARACRGRKTSLKAALLDQRVVAGLGNIYVSEALHHAALSPHRRASTIATRSGAPREAAARLAIAVKRVIGDAIAGTIDPARYRSARFRVYDRAGEACRRRGCGGIIRRRTQAGRSTFYCPACQR